LTWLQLLTVRGTKTERAHSFCFLALALTLVSFFLAFTLTLILL
jgi:hypothetical protein